MSTSSPPVILIYKNLKVFKGMIYLSIIVRTPFHKDNSISFISGGRLILPLNIPDHCDLKGVICTPVLMEIHSSDVREAPRKGDPSAATAICWVFSRQLGLLTITRARSHKRLKEVPSRETRSRSPCLSVIQHCFNYAIMIFQETKWYVVSS